MPYVHHFQLADNYLNHLDAVIGNIADPLIKAQYGGFVAVTAVTVYELAIKTIFIEFAERKHNILGNFTSVYFERINGRIKTATLKDDYIKKFGDKYVKRFKSKLESKEKAILKAEGASIMAAYANIITWRNDFTHGGQLPPATYDEVKRAYVLGRHLIDCLGGTMTR